METNGLSQDTEVGDIVTIEVKPDSVFGFLLGPDINGKAAVITGWERLPGGRMSELQKHGGIHIGDILFAVNDTVLSIMPFEEALEIINDRNVLRKTFKFMGSKEYNRRLSVTSKGVVLPRNRFLSIIKRCRINDGKTSSSGSPFAEYEIICQLRIAGLGIEKEMVHKWSVWKRFSEFQNLHAAMKKTLGWQMSGIEFPSSHTFVLYKLSTEFLDQRRDELSEFWQKLLSLEKVTEFDRHHCSVRLKEFLQVEAHMDLKGPPRRLGGNHRTVSTRNNNNANNGITRQMPLSPTSASDKSDTALDSGRSIFSPRNAEENGNKTYMNSIQLESEEIGNSSDVEED